MSADLYSKETLASAVSGAVASMVALGLCYPLDRVRSVAQVGDKRKSSVAIFRDLVESEGISGLYTGAQHMIFVLGSSNLVYFYFDALLKSFYLLKVNKMRAKRGLSLKGVHDIQNYVNLLIATTSGVLNVLLTTPLWVVATRLAMLKKKKENGRLSRKTSSFSTPSPPKTILQGIFKLAQTEGISALWSGTTASLLLVSNPAIQFSAYEKLKRVAFKVFKVKELNSVQYFIIGALAKMIATVFTYPLQLSQTRLRSFENNPSEKDKNPKTTIQCLQDIYVKQGFSGWFKGMDAKLVQTCLTAAFMFAFYEKLFAISHNIFSIKIKLQ